MPTLPPTPSMLDKAIAIAIMLFILSLISERFVTWLKLYYGKLGKSLVFFSKKSEDLAIENDDPKKEKLREQKILGLNIVISILIALVSHADMIKIFHADSPYNTLGWDWLRSYSWNASFGTTLGSILEAILGCILTGLFISLGSKFWHDLLDMLLQAKEYKRVLADQATYNTDQVKQLESALHYSPMAKARLAIDQNQQLMSDHPNILSILPGSVAQSGTNVPSVDIHLSDGNKAAIPHQLTARFPGGNVFTIPVQVTTGLGQARSQAGVGDPLSNGSIAGCAPGTLGCFLKNGTNFYALTCCHVLTNDKLVPYSGFNVPPGNLAQSPAGTSIGTWAFGIMNTSYDIGYIALDAPATASAFAKPRDVTDLDILQKTPVSFKGASTPAGTGFISNYQCTRPIYYGPSSLSIDNLILITNTAGASPSQGGDSGALVYTTGRSEPIGIIVGADLVFTYAIPINSILSITGMTIH